MNESREDNGVVSFLLYHDANRQAQRPTTEVVLVGIIPFMLGAPQCSQESLEIFSCVGENSVKLLFKFKLKIFFLHSKLFICIQLSQNIVSILLFPDPERLPHSTQRGLDSILQYAK